MTATTEVSHQPAARRNGLEPWLRGLGRVLSPWWMKGKIGEGHFGRGLILIAVSAAVTGWLFATADHLAVLYLRFLAWCAMAVPGWILLSTTVIVWKTYSPKNAE